MFGSMADQATLAKQATLDSPNRLLDSNETSSILDVTTGTLAVWRSEKRYDLPYIKVGRLVRYRLSDVLAWLESRTQAGINRSTFHGGVVMSVLRQMSINGEYVGDLLVDDCDAHLLDEHSWRAYKSGRSFYAATTIRNTKGRKTVGLHRLILRPRPRVFVDHINHNGLDNRRSNLRFCTHTENMRNRVGASIGAVSRFRGVYLARETTWRAAIRCDKKTIHLGSFHSEVSAALAFDRAADKYFGEFRGPRNLPISARGQLLLFDMEGASQTH